MVHNSVEGNYALKKIILSLILIFSVQVCFAQKRVALTIDDVPNTKMFATDSFNSRMLQTMDSLRIPATIFIMGSAIYKTNYPVKNFALINSWIQRDYITPGNHSFNHTRYSSVGFTKFSCDIVQGETLIRGLAAQNNKSIQYFRFPYNDLGANKAQQDSIISFLHNKDYIVAPFTIESSDYIFNSLYTYYLNSGQTEKADSIGKSYVDFTITLFGYFETLSNDQFHRQIPQIYLCHDSPLNAKYLPALIQKLRSRNYSFISLDEAMKDSVYRSEIYYFGKYGYSWIYRWIKNTDERTALMKREPFLMDVYKEYKRIHKLQ